MQTIEAASVEHTRCIKREVNNYAEDVARSERPSLPPPEKDRNEREGRYHETDSAKN